MKNERKTENGKRKSNRPTPSLPGRFAREGDKLNSKRYKYSNLLNALIAYPTFAPSLAKRPGRVGVGLVKKSALCGE